MPGCIESQPAMISEVSCNESTLDFAKERGMSVACITLDENVWGFYLVRSRYKGLMLYYGDKPFVYGLYYDEEKKSGVIGPAIIKDKKNAIECGIPTS
jgi:hypothetical protein